VEFPSLILPLLAMRSTCASSVVLREFTVLDVPPPPPADAYPGSVTWRELDHLDGRRLHSMLPVAAAAATVIISGVPASRRAISSGVYGILHMLKNSRSAAKIDTPEGSKLEPQSGSSSSSNELAAAGLSLTNLPQSPPCTKSKPMADAAAVELSTSIPSTVAAARASLQGEGVHQQVEGERDAVGGDIAAKVATPSADVQPAPPSFTPLQKFCEGLSTLQLSTDMDRFLAGAKLLLRYCDNAGSEPYEPKFRRIRLSNKAYKKHLSGLPAGLECLRAVGFVDGLDAASNEPILVMGTADSELLLSCAYAAQRRLTMLRMWPEPLHACLPAACRSLDVDASGATLLDELSNELSAPHVPQLLAHSDNRKRIGTQLKHGGKRAATKLLASLAELRQNLTATHGAKGEGGGSSSSGLEHASRVKHISNNEEWYDTLLAAAGLVVVDFGATWCGPCNHVKPQFERLSSAPAYADVTFLSVDADECPTLVGNNRVDSFPTFKFFRNSAEEDLPVVGPNIDEVRDRIDELTA